MKKHKDIRKKSAGAGGKLSRGEIVQTRLNEKLRFALELMARYENRTVSSFIEQIIEEASRKYYIYDEDLSPMAMEINYMGDNESDLKRRFTFHRIVKDLWTFRDEPTRFVAFAIAYPNLLTEEETALIQTIQETKYFWTYSIKPGKEPERHVNIFDLVSENLAEYWDKLRKGKIDKQALAKLPIGRIWEPLEPPAKDTRVLYKNPEITDLAPLANEDFNSPSDKFWLNHVEKINTLETIEVKNTSKGTKLIKTFALPHRDELRKLLKKNSTK